MKERGDPIVSVYQLAHGRGFFDDFDRLGPSGDAKEDKEARGAARLLPAPATSSALTTRDGAAGGAATGAAALAAAAGGAGVAGPRPQTLCSARTPPAEPAAVAGRAGGAEAGALVAGRARRVLTVVDREGPRGALLAFMDAHGDNAPLLRLLAACRDEVTDACWGVFPLRPDRMAG